jgi:hypothetical protein
VRPVLLLLLCAVAACAAPPPPEPAEPPPPPPPLVRAALEEWRAWGSVVVVGWPVTRPPDTAATPERFARVLDYWAAVPGTAGIRRRLQAARSGIAVTLAYAVSPDTNGPDTNGEGEGVEPALRPAAAEAVGPPPPLPPEDIALYAYPAWSAAFISAIARQAGVPNEDLPSSPTHARYIDRLLARAMEDPVGAPFLPHAPEDYAPRPGDLLCGDRAWAPLPHWTARLAERGRPRPMHCDVVIGTAPGRVDLIGGNVEDMVVMRRIPADEAGRVLPAPPGKPVYLLVLAARDRG